MNEGMKFSETEPAKDYQSVHLKLGWFIDVKHFKLCYYIHHDIQIWSLKLFDVFIEAMEAGLSEVKSELQSRDDLLRIIEMERLQLHRELLKIGECQNAQENKKR